MLQIRRMKQLEQEKDVLLQGLEVVERAREWYHKQISTVTEKQNYAEKTSCSVCLLFFFKSLFDSEISILNKVKRILYLFVLGTQTRFLSY